MAKKAGRQRPAFFIVCIRTFCLDGWMDRFRSQIALIIQADMEVMTNSEDDILTLNLPILSPEASNPPRFDISQPEWLEMLEGMADIFLSIRPDLLKVRSPVDVRFVMRD